MNPELPSSAASPLSEAAGKSTSELNNLLQIISATSSIARESGQSPEEREKYLQMLRVSVERAERVVADLGTQAGGTSEKKAIHHELAPFIRKPSSTPASTKQSILLVDDEEMALTLMKKTLSQAGFEVTTAQSGFESLDLFRRQPYHYGIVLLDLTMPFMDGEETFNRLRQIRADIPVIICTGFIQHERLENLMKQGLTGFMRKPIDPDEIVGTVRSILQTAKYGNLGQGGFSKAV